MRSGELICMDHTIGVVRASSAVGLRLSSASSNEVWIKNLQGFDSVAHVDHA